MDSNNRSHQIYTKVTRALDYLEALYAALEAIGIECNSGKLEEVWECLKDAFLLLLNVRETECCDQHGHRYSVYVSRQNSELCLYDDNLKEIIVNMKEYEEKGLLAWQDMWEAYVDGNKEKYIKIDHALDLEFSHGALMN